MNSSRRSLISLLTSDQLADLGPVNSDWISKLELLAHQHCFTDGTDFELTPGSNGDIRTNFETDNKGTATRDTDGARKPQVSNPSDSASVCLAAASLSKDFNVQSENCCTDEIEALLKSPENNGWLHRISLTCCSQLSFSCEPENDCVNASKREGVIFKQKGNCSNFRSSSNVKHAVLKDGQEEDGFPSVDDSLAALYSTPLSILFESQSNIAIHSSTDDLFTTPSHNVLCTPTSRIIRMLSCDNQRTRANRPSLRGLELNDSDIMWTNAFVTPSANDRSCSFHKSTSGKVAQSPVVYADNCDIYSTGAVISSNSVPDTASCTAFNEASISSTCVGSYSTVCSGVTNCLSANKYSTESYTRASSVNIIKVANMPTTPIATGKSLKRSLVPSALRHRLQMAKDNSVRSLNIDFSGLGQEVVANVGELSVNNHVNSQESFIGHTVIVTSNVVPCRSDVSIATARDNLPTLIITSKDKSSTSLQNVPTETLSARPDHSHGLDVDSSAVDLLQQTTTDNEILSLLFSADSSPRTNKEGKPSRTKSRSVPKRKARLDINAFELITADSCLRQSPPGAASPVDDQKRNRFQTPITIEDKKKSLKRLRTENVTTYSDSPFLSPVLRNPARHFSSPSSRAASTPIIYTAKQKLGCMAVTEFETPVNRIIGATSSCHKLAHRDECASETDNIMRRCQDEVTTPAGFSIVNFSLKEEIHTESANCAMQSIPAPSDQSHQVPVSKSAETCDLAGFPVIEEYGSASRDVLKEDVQVGRHIATGEHVMQEQLAVCSKTVDVSDIVCPMSSCVTAGSVGVCSKRSIMSGTLPLASSVAASICAAFPVFSRPANRIAHISSLTIPMQTITSCATLPSILSTSTISLPTTISQVTTSTNTSPFAMSTNAGLHFKSSIAGPKSCHMPSVVTDAGKLACTTSRDPINSDFNNINLSMLVSSRMHIPSIIRPLITKSPIPAGTNWRAATSAESSTIAQLSSVTPGSNSLNGNGSLERLTAPKRKFMYPSRAQIAESCPNAVLKYSPPMLDASSRVSPPSRLSTNPYSNVENPTTGDTTKTGCLAITTVNNVLCSTVTSLTSSAENSVNGVANLTSRGASLTNGVTNLISSVVKSTTSIVVSCPVASSTTGMVTHSAAIMQNSTGIVKHSTGIVTLSTGIVTHSASILTKTLTVSAAVSLSSRTVASTNGVTSVFKTPNSKSLSVCTTTSSSELRRDVNNSASPISNEHRILAPALFSNEACTTPVSCFPKPPLRHIIDGADYSYRMNDCEKTVLSASAACFTLPAHTEAQDVGNNFRENIPSATRKMSAAISSVVALESSDKVLQISDENSLRFKETSRCTSTASTTGLDAGQFSELCSDESASVKELYWMRDALSCNQFIGFRSASGKSIDISAKAQSDWAKIIYVADNDKILEQLEVLKENLPEKCEAEITGKIANNQQDLHSHYTNAETPSFNKQAMLESSCIVKNNVMKAASITDSLSVGLVSGDASVRSHDKEIMFSTASGKNINISGIALERAMSVVAAYSEPDNNPSAFLNKTRDGIDLLNSSMDTDSTDLNDGIGIDTGSKLKVLSAPVKDWSKVPQGFRPFKKPRSFSSSVNQRSSKVVPVLDFVQNDHSAEISVENMSSMYTNNKDGTILKTTDLTATQIAEVNDASLALADQGEMTQVTQLDHYAFTPTTDINAVSVDIVNHRKLNQPAHYNDSSVHEMTLSAELSVIQLAEVNDASLALLDQGDVSFTQQPINIMSAIKTSKIVDTEVDPVVSKFDAFQKGCSSLNTSSEQKFPDEAVLANKMSFPVDGFCTSRGAVVSVSEMALKRAARFVETLDIASESNDNKNCDNWVMPPGLGFCTAKGAVLPVSEIVLKRAVQFVGSCYGSLPLASKSIDDKKIDDYCSLAPGGTSDSTANGVALPISDMALKPAALFTDSCDTTELSVYESDGLTNVDNFVALSTSPNSIPRFLVQEAMPYTLKPDHKSEHSESPRNVLKLEDELKLHPCGTLHDVNRYDGISQRNKSADFHTNGLNRSHFDGIHCKAQPQANDAFLCSQVDELLSHAMDLHEMSSINIDNKTSSNVSIHSHGVNSEDLNEKQASSHLVMSRHEHIKQAVNDTLTAQQSESRNFCVGFQTASGAKIKIKKEALVRARTNLVVLLPDLLENGQNWVSSSTNVLAFADERENVAVIDGKVVHVAIGTGYEKQITHNESTHHVLDESNTVAISTFAYDPFDAIMQDVAGKISELIGATETLDTKIITESCENIGGDGSSSVARCDSDGDRSPEIVLFNNICLDFVSKDNMFSDLVAVADNRSLPEQPADNDLETVRQCLLVPDCPVMDDVQEVTGNDNGSVPTTSNDIVEMMITAPVEVLQPDARFVESESGVPVPVYDLIQRQWPDVLSKQFATDVEASTKITDKLTINVAGSESSENSECKQSIAAVPDITSFNADNNKEIIRFIAEDKQTDLCGMRSDSQTFDSSQCDSQMFHSFRVLKEKSENYNFDFQTAGGSRIQVNAQALALAREKLSSTTQNDAAACQIIRILTSDNANIEASDQSPSKVQKICGNSDNQFNSVLNQTGEKESRLIAKNTCLSHRASKADTKIDNLALTKANENLFILNADCGLDGSVVQRDVAKDSTWNVKSHSAGFQTAAGTTVTINPQALAIARKKLQVFECDDEGVSVETVVKKQKEIKSYNFMKENEAKVHVDKSVAVARRKFQEIQCDAQLESCFVFSAAEKLSDREHDEQSGRFVGLTESMKPDESKRQNYRFGFTTAGGNKVSIDEEALAKVREKLLDSQSVHKFHDSSVLSEFNKDSALQISCPFQTASGTSVTVDKQALGKATDILQNVDSDRGVDNSAAPVSTSQEKSHVQEKFSFGFITANGSAVKISDESLKHVRSAVSEVNHNCKAPNEGLTDSVRQSHSYCMVNGSEHHSQPIRSSIKPSASAISNSLSNLESLKVPCSDIHEQPGRTYDGENMWSEDVTISGNVEECRNSDTAEKYNNHLNKDKLSALCSPRKQVITTTSETVISADQYMSKKECGCNFSSTVEQDVVGNAEGEPAAKRSRLLNYNVRMTTLTTTPEHFTGDRSGACHMFNIHPHLTNANHLSTRNQIFLVHSDSCDSYVNPPVSQGIDVKTVNSAKKLVSAAPVRFLTPYKPNAVPAQNDDKIICKSQINVNHPVWMPHASLAVQAHNRLKAHDSCHSNQSGAPLTTPSKYSHPLQGKPTFTGKWTLKELDTQLNAKSAGSREGSNDINLSVTLTDFSTDPSSCAKFAEEDAPAYTLIVRETAHVTQLMNAGVGNIAEANSVSCHVGSTKIDAGDRAVPAVSNDIGPNTITDVENEFYEQDHSNVAVNPTVLTRSGDSIISILPNIETEEDGEEDCESDGVGTAVRFKRTVPCVRWESGLKPQKRMPELQQLQTKLMEQPQQLTKQLDTDQEQNKKNQAEEERMQQPWVEQLERTRLTDEMLKVNEQLRIKAAEGQLARIASKSLVTVHSQPGILWRLRRDVSTDGCHKGGAVEGVRKRLPFLEAVQGGHPQKYSYQQLYSYGVHRSTLEVNHTTAEEFCFKSSDVCAPPGGLRFDDNALLVFNAGGTAGKEEFANCLMDMMGVAPQLIDISWIYNHYRWIVYKLAAMERSFPLQFAGRCLTPQNVVAQLKYRYDIEIDHCQRSAVKKIYERDDTAKKGLVLRVSHIDDHGDEKSTHTKQQTPCVIELTDGWYGIKAVLDQPLTSLVSTKRLRVGDKIMTYGADLIGSQEATSPLEAPSDVMLKLNANSTRCAAWHARLGFIHCARPPVLPLISLYSDGGTVSCVDVVIARVYPLQYMERLSDTSVQFLTPAAERKAAMLHERSRQKNLEELYAKYQKEFEQDQETATNGYLRLKRGQSLSAAKIRHLHTGPELFAAYQCASDPTEFHSCLTVEQRDVLAEHIHSERASLQQRLNSYVQAKLSEEEDQQVVTRSSTPMLKLLVVGCTKQDSDSQCESMLTIWRPSDELLELLKEGSRFLVYNLSTGPVRCSRQSVQSGSRCRVSLTSTRSTRYEQRTVDNNLLDLIYEPRQVLRYTEIGCIESWKEVEIDTIGIIVDITTTTQYRDARSPVTVYCSDESLNFLALQFTTGLALANLDKQHQNNIEEQLTKIKSAFGEILQSDHGVDERNSVGLAIACTTLIKRSAGVVRPPVIPVVYVTDQSTISFRPHQRHLVNEFNKLKTVLKDGDKISTMRQQLSTLLRLSCDTLHYDTNRQAANHLTTILERSANETMIENISTATTPNNSRLVAKTLCDSLVKVNQGTIEHKALSVLDIVADISGIENIDWSEDFMEASCKNSPVISVSGHSQTNSQKEESQRTRLTCSKTSVRSSHGKDTNSSYMIKTCAIATTEIASNTVATTAACTTTSSTPCTAISTAGAAIAASATTITAVAATAAAAIAVTTTRKTAASVTAGASATISRAAAAAATTTSKTTTSKAAAVSTQCTISANRAAQITPSIKTKTRSSPTETAMPGTSKTMLATSGSSSNSLCNIEASDSLSENLQSSMITGVTDSELEITVLSDSKDDISQGNESMSRKTSKRRRNKSQENELVNVVTTTMTTRSKLRRLEKKL